MASRVCSSIDDWEMRSNRNTRKACAISRKSIDDWEMRSNRNIHEYGPLLKGSIDDWEMRSNRNYGLRKAPARLEYRRLGNAL